MTDEPSATRLALVADWISRRSTLVLAILLLETGLVLGLIHAWRAGTGSPASPPVGTRAVSTSGCGPVRVHFAAASTAGDIRRWLVNFEAAIVGGPDSRGAFELSVPRLTVPEVGEALGALAEDVSVNPLCPPTDAR